MTIPLTDSELETAISEIIVSQKFSSKEAQALRNVPRDQKVKLVQFHANRNQRKANGLKVPSTPQVKAQTTAILQSQTSISMLEEGDIEADPDPFGKIPTELSLANGTEPKRSSLLMQTRALKRQRDTAEISPFGAKHHGIIQCLMDAIRPQEDRLLEDKDIMDCVGRVFEDRENKSADLEDDDEFGSPRSMSSGSQLSISRSTTYNPLHPDNVSALSPQHNKNIKTKSNAVHSRRPRFVCKSVEEMQVYTVSEAIEFMLQEMWKEDASQTLYQKVVKYAATHWKAKIFAVGIERKDRTYRLKSFRKCFMGTQGVDFVLLLQFVNTQSADKRESACDLLNSWVTRGFIRHVTGDHRFKDEELFYEVDDEAISKKCQKLDGDSR